MLPRAEYGVPRVTLTDRFISSSKITPAAGRKDFADVLVPGLALRVTANENREMRMQDAERKAASLPAKLTVPMILFFLPCLFIVILGPAIIQIKHMM